MIPLPVELRVEGRATLAIGAGAELAAKVTRLVEAGASVTVIAESPDPEVEALAARSALTLHRRAFEDADLEGAFVVFLAAGNDALAAHLFAWATREARLFCSIDRPETCTFTNVAIARASGLTLTVSSGGASPGLSRRLREDLEAALGDPRLARFVRALAEARDALPRGERARRLSAAVKDFRLEVTLRFPAWFEGEGPVSAGSPGGGPRPP